MSANIRMRMGARLGNGSVKAATPASSALSVSVIEIGCSPFFLSNTAPGPPPRPRIAAEGPRR